MKRTIIRNRFTVTLACALAVGLAPTAQAADKGCSNATLTSTLAYTSTGFFTAPAAPTLQAGPFAGVGVATFDGNGDATAKRQDIPRNYKGHMFGESGLHGHVNTRASRQSHSRQVSGVNRYP
jgi:hypothetical protein